MHTLPRLSAVAPWALLCLLVAGCLPSRGRPTSQPAQQQSYPQQSYPQQSYPQQGYPQQGYPQSYGNQQTQWQQPQPQPQPTAAQPGAVFPSVLGLPAIGLPWMTAGAPSGGAQGQQPATPLPFPFPMPWGNTAGTQTSGSSGGSTPVTGTTAVDPNHPADWARMEQEVLAEVNVRRAQGAVCGGKSFSPARPLVMNAALQTSARLHSRDMATKNYFSHTSQDGRSMTDRIKAQGFAGKMYGENIAAGRATAAATVDQWMNSPGHCENIMNAPYTMLGVGYAFSSGSEYGHYWTQNFGG